MVYGVAQFAAGRFCNFDEKGARRKRSDQKAVLQMDQKATTKFDSSKGTSETSHAPRPAAARGTSP